MTRKIIQFPKTDLCSSLSTIGTENSKYVAAVTAIEKTMVTLSDMEMPQRPILQILRRPMMRLLDAIRRFKASLLTLQQRSTVNWSIILMSASLPWKA